MSLAVIKEMQGQDCEWGEDYRAAVTFNSRATNSRGSPHFSQRTASSFRCAENLLDGPLPGSPATVFHGIILRYWEGLSEKSRVIFFLA